MFRCTLQSILTAVWTRLRRHRPRITRVTLRTGIDVADPPLGYVAADGTLGLTAAVNEGGVG